MTMALSRLQRRVLEISYRHRLSHIGSCLGVVDLLDEIYTARAADEPVILSCGHAALGWYVALEKHLGKDAEQLFLKHGVHPKRCLADGIEASAGSLGMALSVSVGRALARRDRRVWCIISDGELAEGVVYESLNHVRLSGLSNLHVYLHANGYAACRPVSIEETTRVAKALLPAIFIHTRSPESYGLPFLRGLDAHYHTITDDEYNTYIARIA